MTIARDALDLTEQSPFTVGVCTIGIMECFLFRISLVHPNQNELNQIVEKHVKRYVFRYICIAFWNLVPFSENLVSLNQVSKNGMKFSSKSSGGYLGKNAVSGHLFWLLQDCGGGGGVHTSTRRWSNQILVYFNPIHPNRTKSWSV